jgi:preprotein translocase subunit YajC
MVFSVMLQAQSAGWGNLVLLVLMGFATYLFFIKPQSDYKKKMRNFRDGLVVGDRVLVNGAVLGKVKEVKAATVVVTVANHVDVEVVKEALTPDHTDLKA